MKKEEWSTKNKAIDFLLYSYFGIDQNDLETLNEAEIIEICAQRAYRDLNRTLDFKEKPDGKKGGEKNRIEEAHKTFRNKVRTKVKEQIEILLNGKADTFDTLHCSACKAICDEAAEHNVLNEPFSYGQAQKWLNMTMKYMWLLGLRQAEFNDLLPVMHVPVDSYIMEAVWKEPRVELPMNAGKKREGPFSSGGKDGKVKAWSTWGYREYHDFQISLRKWCKKRAPIEWEGSAWIDIAQKRA